MIILGVALVLVACGESDYVPKPRIYPKMEFPKRAYKPFENNYCGFTFEQPVATEVQKKEEFFGGKAGDCWFNLYYPALNGSVYFTYYPITPNKQLYKLVEDTYRMEDQHTSKASYMEHSAIIRGDAMVFGELTDIFGDVGTPFQFFITDSTTHFIRAGLTFNAAANSDSLAPAIEYVKQDMIHLIETFQWKE